MKKNLFFLILTTFFILFLLKANYALAGCDQRYCSPPDCTPPRCDTCSWCSPSAPSTGPAAAGGGVFGGIKLPATFKYKPLLQGGMIDFFNNLIRLLIVIGGLWAFINLILAGYGFLSAGEDPKKMAAAWQKIWQSMLGLLFILGSFLLAAIFGYLLFGDPRAILNPKIYGP